MRLNERQNERSVAKGLLDVRVVAAPLRRSEALKLHFTGVRRHENGTAVEGRSLSTNAVDFVFGTAMPLSLFAGAERGDQIAPARRNAIGSTFGHPPARIGIREDRQGICRRLC